MTITMTDKQTDRQTDMVFLVSLSYYSFRSETLKATTNKRRQPDASPFLHKGCTYWYTIYNLTLLHYGSLPFTSVVGSESRPSSSGIFVT